MDPYLDPLPLPVACVDPPIRGSVLVIAPHPDDELIGPGGTLLLHRRLGDPVHVVVVTDGTNDGRAAGDDGVGGAGGSGVRAGGGVGGGIGAGVGDRAALRATREAESRAVAASMGTTISFLGFPDGARAREEDLGAVVPLLAAIIRRVQPAVVYAPHEGELHADHFVVALAARRAVAISGVAASGIAAVLLGYEIWGTLVPEFVVDVTPVMEQKVTLAGLYVSQIRHTAISHCFSGLNAYRSALLPKEARYGEAFRRLLPDARAR